MKQLSEVKSIGKLEYRVDDDHYIGKRAGCANIVEAKGSIVIATAAHCVYEIGVDKFNKEIFFYHLNSNYKRPIKVSRVVVHKNWIQEKDVAYDTAFLNVEDSCEVKNMLAYSMPVLFSGYRNQDIIIYGLKKRLFNYQTFGESTHIINDFKGLPDMIGGKCKGGVGMSGGPWIVRHKKGIFQCSLTSMKMRSQKGILWGPYWGRDIETVYLYASGISNDKRNLVIHNL